MGMYIGPQEWWLKTKESADGLALSCPEGTILPDGSALICKAGGKAWIVAPETTEVGEPWGNYTACGDIDNSPAGASVHPEITSTNFPVLCTQLVSCGFTPGDWFVPCKELLQNPGYVCRTNWDSFSANCCYWSSSESTDVGASLVKFPSNGVIGPCCPKNLSYRVRAMRCVTY
jgi:hypothetical protein